MNASRILVATVLAISMLAPVSVAQENKTRTKIKFKQIVKGSTMIGMSVMDEDQNPLGHVAEVMVDHRNGYLALFGIRKTGAPEGQLLLVPPIRVNYKPNAGYLQLTQPLSAFKSELRSGIDQIERGQMAAIYKETNATPYWKKAYGLISLDDLDGRVVRGKNRKKVGRIVDVAFAPQRDWKVAYIVLGEVGDSPGKLMAVPMGVFNRPKYSKSWIIPAPATILRDMPSFNDKWPTEVERGWIELAAVKGGRDPLSGAKGK
jgi:sporulation protein YlmC with PRC-barrel domain